jgi:hypothetical protein
VITLRLGKQGFATAGRWADLGTYTLNHDGTNRSGRYSSGTPSKDIGAAVAESLSAAAPAVVVNYAGNSYNSLSAAFFEISDDAVRVFLSCQWRPRQMPLTCDDCLTEPKRLRHARRPGEQCWRLQVSTAGGDHRGEFQREFIINVLGAPPRHEGSSKHFGPNSGNVKARFLKQAAIYSRTKGAVGSITRGLAVQLGQNAGGRPGRARRST